MINDNCTLCMYSEYTESTIYITDLIKDGKDYCKCNHINSPYYNELVNDEISCRLFLDSNKYFLKKDRKDKIVNLKNKNK